MAHIRGEIEDVLGLTFSWRSRALFVLIGTVVSLAFSSASRGQTLTERGLRRSAARDNYTKVSVFGVEGKGTKFVYLFDRSGSMDGPPLAAAKKQLLESMEALGDTQQFDIIFFNERLQIFDSSNGRHRTTFATDTAKKSAAEFLARVKADGGTDRAAALRYAIALKPDVIFFLSDADKPMSAAELDAITQLNERVGVQVCAIEFGKGNKPDKSSLADIAKANNGQYVFVDTTKLTK